jgi:tetratricopeptide (TPR) repeat protein
VHDAEGGLTYIDQARSFYEKGGYRRDAALAHYEFGRANNLKGNYDVALQAFEQGLEFARQAVDRSFQVQSHRGIGLVRANQERYSEALDHFNESYAIYQALNNHLHAGRNLINRGNMLWRLGRYDEARKAFRQASLIAAQPGNRNKQMFARISLLNAQMLLSERRFPEAIVKSQQARVLNAETGHAAEAMYTLGLAQALSSAKRQGRRMCEQAVEMATRANDPWMHSGARLALAEALLESGDAEGALNTAREVQKSFEHAGQQESKWRAWLIAGRASLRVGDAAKAGQYALRAEGLLANLRQKWGTEAYNDYLTRPDIHNYQWPRNK